MDSQNTYTVFEGANLLFHGSLDEVVVKIKKKMGKADHADGVLIFSDITGKVMDFNFQGSEKDVLKRLEVFIAEAPESASGPGRPKLGVVSREVSLLPRHWEWLAGQDGGASATLRRLIDEAKKKTSGAVNAKQAQERAYKFMSAVAGDLPGYEEALRALYKKDEKIFSVQIQPWPRDVRKYAMRLAQSVFE